MLRYRDRAERRSVSVAVFDGMTLAEAGNELALVVTGAYGKPVAKSMGSPLRVHVRWKYGFKSVKSIVDSR